MKVRRAKKEDCKRLLELIQELALFEKAPHEVTVSIDEFIFAGFSEHPVWWAFVVEDDDQIVGFALYYIRYSTWKGCRMYLEDIIITEEYRGKGLGKLLFDQLIIEAVERNLKGIVWQVLEWNEDAIEFYKKYNASMDPEWVNGSLSEEQIKYFYQEYTA